MIYIVPQCRHFKCLLPATGREITIDCKHKQVFTALKKASAFYRTSNGKTIRVLPATATRQKRIAGNRNG